MGKNNSDWQIDTQLVLAGRADPRIVSSPVYRASTILFEDTATLEARTADRLNRDHLYYGRMGTPTTRALEDGLTLLDASVGAVITPSGVASITDILSCFLRPGDHLLMVDSVYGPTRNFCLGPLRSRNIETTFYEPLLGAGIEDLLRDNTRMVYLESPGSDTFEVQDVPAIVRAARSRGVLTAIDNTWATPLRFNPLDLGVDLAMQSGTKYLNGHADCLYGVTTTRDESLFRRLQRYTLSTGSHLGPDEAWLAQRGLRTLSVRLAAHERAALAVAQWLETQSRVRRILHPAFASCPGHENFRRDFSGSTGLFSVVMDTGDEEGTARFVDALQLFGIGYSWGGFESLVLPMSPKRECRSLTLAKGEVILRFHVGLEALDDLIDDLAAALQSLGD